jgi:3-methyladenine DNA glycosylase AlkD
MQTISYISSWLQDNKDQRLKDFNAKLIPNIDKERVLGITVSKLKAFAKRLYKENNYKEFINDLPHNYLEENHLHTFIIAEIKDFDSCALELEKFLPYIDNWATCDSLKPSAFKKNKDKLLVKIDKWIKSEKTYTIRFAISMLLTHFLDDEFNPKYLQLVAKVKSSEYYVNMMKAWYFATALAKQYDSTLPYLLDNKLDVWTHNKTIQKAIESYRITKSQKAFLKNLKIKGEKQ